jgi:hypothetical protein
MAVAPCAAQRERVGGASRRQIQAEKAGQGVQSIRQADRDAGGAPRQRVAAAAGQVVLGEAHGHRAILALRPRVLAPHDALQLRELADHPRREVALAQPSRPRDHGAGLRVVAQRPGHSLG